MFVLNFKLKKHRGAVRFLIAAAVIVALIVFACVKNSSGAGAETATCDEIGEYSLIAETEEQRLDILRSFGIEDARLEESDEVTVPEDFNSVTEKYNELQKQIGLDLSPYKGQKAERLTYSVNGKNEACAVLLVSNGRLIGGHRTSRTYGEDVMPLCAWSESH